ncbi:hypothetical protein B0680_04595 [Moraxella pluranimalium]|uniref:Uncharacterized protein n=1 Tax=Moraxella pluranimalium TaxID=470453 RepID=A0A1T0CQT7_9GAMM|nr:hypothetical protein B0680_04595 [Moraxella pluranimalium]
MASTNDKLFNFACFLQIFHHHQFYRIKSSLYPKFYLYLSYELLINYPCYFDAFWQNDETMLQ